MSLVALLINNGFINDSGFMTPLNVILDGNSCVVGANDFVVSPGSGLQVQVAAGQSLVFSSSKVSYIAVKNSATINQSITSNASGSTRIDLICLKVDTTVTSDAPMDNVASIQYVTGTPGSGIPATPAGYQKLAEVTVASGASSFSSGNIADKRVKMTLQPALVVPGGDGWSQITATLTYSSTDGHTFVVTTSADLTGSIQVGDRIKFTNNSTTFYGIVTAISSSTMTLYGGTTYSVANSAITSPSYSHDKSPYGFSTDPSIWTEIVTDVTNKSQASPVNGTWYNINSLSLAVPIGKWFLEYYVTAGSARTSTTTVDAYVTLSTANNSQSDSDFTAFTNLTVATGSLVVYTTLTRRKVVSLASKTSYFLNTQTDTTADTIYNRGDLGTTMIRALCAFI